MLVILHCAFFHNCLELGSSRIIRATAHSKQCREQGSLPRAALRSVSTSVAVMASRRRGRQAKAPAPAHPRGVPHLPCTWTRASRCWRALRRAASGARRPKAWFSCWRSVGLGDCSVSPLGKHTTTRHLPGFLRRMRARTLHNCLTMESLAALAPWSLQSSSR